MQPDRDMRQALGVVGPLAQPHLGSGVGDDVPPFGRADVGGNGNHRHTGDQAAGDGQRGGGGRGGQHRRPLRTADAFGHRSGGADEVAAAEHGAVDAHRVADVGTAGDGRGVQRGQQHASEATRSRARHTWRVDEIQRIASREVYRNDWMTVREDEVRRPDGSRGIYSVIDKPTYALIIARDGERFRLVEQFRYPLGLRRWEFPQGTAPGRAHLEPAELAHRELREETGLRADSMIRSGCWTLRRG